jgi:hypothetical protein
MYQYVTRDACSSRRYHMLERTTKAGWQADSKMPRRVRTVMRPARSLQAA